VSPAGADSYPYYERRTGQSTPAARFRPRTRPMGVFMTVPS